MGSARTNEDEYDLEDDFIDDAVGEDIYEDRATTKHTGYFVNAGALDVVQPPTSKYLGSKRGCVYVIAASCTNQL